MVYIESVYYISNREDQGAVASLTNIPAKYPKPPMAAKAAALIDVLKRRKQIEEYLTNLQVQRVPDDSIVIDDTKSAATTAENGTRLTRNDSNMLVKEDTTQLAKARIHLPASPAVQGQKPSPALSGMDKLQANTANLKTIQMDAEQRARVHQPFG